MNMVGPKRFEKQSQVGKAQAGIAQNAKDIQPIKWQDIPYLNVSGELKVDPADKNNGVVIPGITFGSKSQEGISSNRTGNMNPSGLDFYTAGAVRLSIDSKGNVGIGTNKPRAKLEVSTDDSGQGDVIIDGRLKSVSNKHGGGLFVDSTEERFVGNNGGDGIGFYNGGGWQLLVVKSGKVGIGTATPSEKLEVNGNIMVTGDVILKGADCAEEFSVTDTEPIDPGTVMVIAAEGSLMASQQAYDKRVAGVVSGAGDLHPGIILDSQNKETGRLPLAMTGKVYCKVDADYCPVEVGDLLTTSPTCGHAMKASDYSKAFGTIIGKALRRLEAGKGLIPILVALQ
jgi:hypothetical protein